MKFIGIILLSICVTGLLAARNYSIIGAGPVGLFLSLRLLDENFDESKVTIYELRKDFIRPQCLRIPFILANKIPAELKVNLWPNELLRNTIFKARKKGEEKFDEFWPLMNNEHFPRIHVGDFQTNILKYLNTKHSEKFKIIYKSVVTTEVPPNDEKNISIDSLDSDIIFFAAGGGKANELLREKLKIKEKKEIKNHGDLDGVYLTYDRKNIKPDYYENYMRKGKPLSRQELSSHGITYSATNNANGSVQLYTYDVTEPFKKIYKNLIVSKSQPEAAEKAKSLIKWSSFPNSVIYKDGKIISRGVPTEDEKNYMKTYAAEVKAHLDKLLTKYEIELPDDAHLQYAPRKIYAFTTVSSKLAGPKSIPVVFAGDAMGGTDYKYGLNLGRGLFEADEIARLLGNQTATVNDVITKYQTYWDGILEAEFTDGERDLSSENKIYYKYVVMGRNVDGTVLEDKNEHFKIYVDALAAKKAKQKRRRLKK